RLPPRARDAASPGRRGRRCRRSDPPCGELGGSLLGDGVQPLADLLDVVAELVQPRQGGETLQPEHTLEKRRNAITNRTADTVRATGFRDQSALDQARN